MFLYTIEKIFPVKGRGYIITPGPTQTWLHEKLKINIGDPIKLLFTDGTVILTEITGLNFRFPCDLRINSSKEIPIGTEVWLLNNVFE